ncbi:nuclear transport factor 2 family protein [Kineosporia rhizophila]|uniref:nuclear transport factor 2 family protein n=1 Tax=Kineosporia rhizophila TaxID=84633 RepID=UPI000A43799A|nr:nuclear transport factor 2 family protein [Kineosporia rhizophila]MCE0538543.1 nuclear transport factor 2 family protein [Kineosporia rhizophila]
MSPTTQPSPAQHALSEHLRLVSAGQIDEWVELYTPEGVIEFPFAPTGVPTRVQGRQALLEHMRSFPQTFDVRFVDLVFHDLTDPHTAIAEFRSTGTAIPTGKPYEQTVVAVVRTDGEGRITRFVDYWNPLVAIEALTPADQPAV